MPVTQESTRVGGWTTYSCDMSEEALKVFEKAFKGFVGVSYTQGYFILKMAKMCSRPYLHFRSA